MAAHTLPAGSAVQPLTPEEARAEILAAGERQPPGWLLPLFGMLAIVGFGWFAVRVASGDDPHPWRIYLQNLMLFTGIAQGAVMYTVAMTVAKAKWGRPVRRLAESFVLFLPVAFLLSLPLYGVMDQLWPWVEHPVEAKQAYLNPGFFTIRGVVGMLLLFGLSLCFVYHSLRPEVGRLRDSVQGRRRDVYDRLSAGWRGDVEEAERSDARRTLLAPILALVFAVTYSLLAWDYLMSLDPHWYSTLFGAWIFMSAFLSGIAATGILVAWVPRWLGLERYWTPSHRHDQGKMTFAFATFWAYLTWSQFIVIWYGKLAEDWPYLLHRGQHYPAVVIAMLLLVWFIPWVGLMGIAPKRNPVTLSLFSGILLLGLWVKLWLLIVPSVSPETRSMLGLDELLVTLGFAGLFALTTTLFLRTFPVLDTRDAHLIVPYRPIQPHP
ncbi:MAG: hypothetical protein H0V09_08990 [Gemmatimonadetes bacterium]|nr:hypothetical protein [Gemmatimonadota bacterium]